MARDEQSSDSFADWLHVGTVVGNAGIAEFTFILKKMQAKVGDIVALELNVPGVEQLRERQVLVWGRITDIRRFNPFFPYEAAQELSGEGISLEDTVLSGTQDQLEGTVLILGATEPNKFSALFPLTYPVKPASRVCQPPADVIRQLLVGGREDERGVEIGSLIARHDVEVKLSAPRLVSRHLAVLAMTGGGKTVAARRIIRELINHGYPLFILDPHGDYIGLWKCRGELPADISLFYPELLIPANGEHLIERIIGQMTNGLSEPQADFLRQAFHNTKPTEGEPAVDYIARLIEYGQAQLGSGDKRRTPTIYAVLRSLRIVEGRLKGMRSTSEQMRRTKNLRIWSSPLSRTP